jgi:hypothetical protein
MKTQYNERFQILPPDHCYWTVPLILDNSYIVGKLTNSKIADTKVSELWRF